MVDRSLYYFSKIFSSTLEKGEEYKKLPRVIINILNYNHYKDEETQGLWHFLLEDEYTHKKDSNLLNIYMLELTKYEISNSDSLHKWISFLKAAEDINVKEVAKENVYIKKAEEELKKISIDRDFIEQYNIR